VASQRTDAGRYFTLSRGIDVGGLLLHRQVVYFVTGVYTTYEGTKTVVEGMHLEYQALLKDDPDLPMRLDELPGRVFSGRKRPAKGINGVFFCFSLPALDTQSGEFTEAAGTTRWYLYDLTSEEILEEPADIIGSIRSDPKTPRKCSMDRKSLIQIRAQILRHIKNTYLKRLDAPVGVKPTLKCWMEITDG
jgi:hypothetical protein